MDFDLVQPGLTIHIVFLSLECITLVIFIYFVIKYTQRYDRDPFTLSCFASLIIGLALKIALKPLSMIINGVFKDIKSATCVTYCSFYSVTCFMTIAILVNSFRWILVILSAKQQVLNLSYKASLLG